jgi:signal transduction histidine kinase
MKNTPVETESETNSIESFLKDAEKKPPASKEANLSKDGSISFTASFLTEMIQFIKNTLLSINNVNHLSIEKFNDVEFRKYSRKSIYQDIKQIDSVLNALLNYININTPIVKKNTIHIILEEIFEANEGQAEAKKIKIFNKFEQDLFSTPYEGSIGFLTRSIDQKGTVDDKAKVVPLKDRRCIEVLIISTGHKDPFEQLESVSETPAIENEKTIGLILQLIRELIQRSQGMIEFEVDEKKSRTLFTLRLPCERRQVVYYEPIKI